MEFSRERIVLDSVYEIWLLPHSESSHHPNIRLDKKIAILHVKDG
jgi:hypothetical protein